MASAPAMRLRRPRWKDPRLLIGVALVITSILLGGLLVARLSATTPVLAARVPLVPGERIAAEDLVTVEVRLGESAALYVSDPAQLPEGAIVAQGVGEGELLPVAAVGQSGGEAELRPVVVPVAGIVAQSVAPGSLVELWRVGDGAEGGEAAELIVERAVVRRIDEGSTLGMRSQSVEVLVPRAQLAEVLEVLAREDRLEVIGVPGAFGVQP